VLGLLGGAGGIALAWLGVRALPAILPPNLPRLGEIALDGRVLLAAAILTIATVLAFGIAPSLGGVAAGRFEQLRTGRGAASSGERTRGALVALEMGLAVVLTVGAALMLRTLASLTSVDPGFRTDHLLTMRLQPAGFDSDVALRAYWQDVLTRVEEIPGVVSAATILHLPTSGRTWQAPIEVEGRPLAPGASPQRSAWQVVSTGWFRTAGVPVLSGRDFDGSDVASAPRVIAVNGAFVARHFPGEDPIGKRIKAGNATQNEIATIVAVVGGIRHDSLNADPRPEVYVPFGQRIVWATSLVLRTTADPAIIAALARERIWSVNRNVPISEVRTMDELYHASLGRPRMVLVLLSAFSIVGLMLGSVGIYGVVAYGVRQRTREIGIRAALGADRADIAKMVVGSGVRWAVVGVALGIPVALAASRLMRGLVFGIGATDPLSFAVVPVVLLTVATVASWIPARKASNTDPTVVLRSE
jgi:predicted permease